MSWMWQPPWEQGVIVGALVILIALLALRAWGERRGIARGRLAAILGLRLAVILCLLVIALNPTAVRQQIDTEMPTLAILVDDSASMAVSDVATQQRAAAAAAALDRAWPQLNRHFHLDLRAFSRAMHEISLDRYRQQPPTGSGTDIGQALTTLIDEQAQRSAQAGILLISDGRETHPGAREAARLALARGVPLWTVTTGGAVDHRDIWVEASGSEVLAFAGESVAIAATIHQVGFDHRIIPVEIHDDDGGVLEQLEVTPNAQGVATVTARVTAPDSGERSVRVVVPVQDGEADSGNNQRSIHLRAVPGPVRVLLIEGQPHWDSKFLVQSLASHPSVSLSAWYRLGEERTFTLIEGGDPTADGSAGFPNSRQALAAYDVIMLGRGSDGLLSGEQLRLLTEFVADGGSLVFHRGRPYDGRSRELAHLEPVLWSSGSIGGVPLRLSEAGRSAPLFDLDPSLSPDQAVARMRSLDRVERTRGLKPLASSLAVAGDGASAEAPIVVAWQPFGQGRVLTVNAGGLWRWGFHGMRNEFDEVVYDRLWSGMLRWLQAGGDFLAGHDVALRSERRRLGDEELLRVEVRSRLGEDSGYRPTLRVRHSDNGEVVAELEPGAAGSGRFRAEMGPFAPGAYTLELHSSLGRPQVLEQAITVVSSSREWRNLSADPDLMTALAQSSDGASLSLDAISTLPEMVRRWQQRQAISDSRSPLWAQAWLLLLMVALLATEWWLRRRGGLL